MTQDAGTTRATVVRVRTEVAAVAKTFDYAVPARWQRRRARRHPGPRARSTGGRVRGWVVDDDVGPPAGRRGPPAEVVAGLGATARRGGAGGVGGLALGRPGLVLPPHRVARDDRARAARAAARCRPAPRPRRPTAPRPWSTSLAQGRASTVVRLPPLTDPIDLVLSVAGRSRPCAPAAAACWCSSRRRVGGAAVGAPGTPGRGRPRAPGRRPVPAGPSWSAAGPRAWAPVPQLAAVVVLDAHDAAYREESAPTYSAVDVLRRTGPARGRARAFWPRRCRRWRWPPDRRCGRSPPSRLRGAGGMARPGAGRPSRRRPAERHVLRGVRPPGPLGPRRCRRRAERGPLVCVYNRTGGARLLACAPLWRAGPLRPLRRSRGAARGEEVLRCPRCDETRPVVCAACGRLRMKTLRAGVSRLREELAALLGAEVGEVAGPRRRDRRDAQPRRRRPSSSAPRRCCTGSAAPPPWPSSTSICTCWRPGSPPPRRRWPCSSGPRRLVGPARHGPRVGPRAGPDAGARPPGAAGASRWVTRRRCWPRRRRSAAPRRCRRSPRWRWSPAHSPPPTPRRRRRLAAADADATASRSPRSATTGSSCGPTDHRRSVRPAGPDAPAARTRAARRGRPGHALTVGRRRASRHRDRAKGRR